MKKNNYLPKLLFFSLVVSVLIPVLAQGQIKIENPLKYGDIPSLIKAVMDFIFMAAIVISPLLVIYAGALLVVSGGDPAKTQTAQKIILNTAIGLLVIFLARGLVQVVLNVLKGP